MGKKPLLSRSRGVAKPLLKASVGSSSRDHQQTSSYEAPTCFDQQMSDRRNVEESGLPKLMEMKREKEMLETRRKELELIEKFNDSQTESTQNLLVQEIIQNQSEDVQVKLNVGGQIFVTSLRTINQNENMLKVMLNSDFNIDKDENGCIVFADRNPEYFPIILEHIRTGSTTYIGLWEEKNEETMEHLRKLLVESDYFGTSKLSARIATMIRDIEQSISESNERKLQRLKIEKRLKEAETQPEKTWNLTMANDQQNADYKWLTTFTNITSKHREVFEKQLLKSELNLLTQKERIREQELNVKTTTITFNARGTRLSIGKEKILMHPDSVFYSLVNQTNNQEIFVDRDPTAFSYLLEYLQNGHEISLPKEYSKRKVIYKEAKEFKLQGLIDLLDPLRYPIEDIGESNMKIKKEEDFLRNLFAVDRNNPILDDPYLHLVNVFDAKHRVREEFQHSTPPEKVPLLFDFENTSEAEKLLNPKSGLVKPHVPKVCETRQAFFTQFNAFTCGLFKNMDWSNVFAAGGGILACLLQAPHEKEDISKEIQACNDEKKSSSTVDKSYWEDDDDSEPEVHSSDSDYFTSSSDEEYRKSLPKPKKISQRNQNLSADQRLFQYYSNSKMWQNSDVDLFLYGLTEHQAEAKIVYLYQLFKKNLEQAAPFLDGYYIGKLSHLFSYTIRPIQIILRLYKSPTEILCGFDIPCCCVGFDGNQVYCLPRAVVSLATRTNIVDPDRQSTTYEMRLVKYAHRGFRIGVAGYDPNKVRHPILKDASYLRDVYYYYHQSSGDDEVANLKKVTGLARILLILHGYINCHQKNHALWAVGGRSTLEKTEQLLQPSKLHDYAELNYSSCRWRNAYNLYKQISRRLRWVKHVLHKKPFFDYSLNDINKILHASKQRSTLPRKIKWITVEPGRQFVGSFHPETRNFFKDAYLDPKGDQKRKYKYQWRKRYGYDTDFDAKTSKALEKQYRQYLKSGSDEHRLFSVSPDVIIDFQTRCICDKRGAYVAAVKREKIKSTVKHVKRLPKILFESHNDLLNSEDDNDWETVEDSSDSEDL
ncbi:hypothetical protein C9374_007776 [Naegleria lovaniensis]|uniref:BTB domain-containing protein n=1 Tax=Naegleria lovaniensis TaxID=51637 RepID=A0AA88KIQ6_NAELO|nr:uncharacterized protein C9374_007776 [Naegleria lovaniensis]KAG2379138.1 hypothetical protein C9374_007776 [Naegleria lovaniensis]